jgi:hypothetical protein
MEKIKEQVGFKGTLQEFFTFMRTSPQFQLGNNDAGRAQYIKMSEDYLGGYGRPSCRSISASCPRRSWW